MLKFAIGLDRLAVGETYMVSLLFSLKFTFVSSVDL